MADLTFIVPIGPDHLEQAKAAVASIKAQTIPVEFISLVDVDQVGPGVLRNRMLQEVKTRFVTFLDADDQVHPEFAERCIKEFDRIGGNRYIYTDWIDSRGQLVQAPALNGPNGSMISSPDKIPYCGGTWHVITTLLPTEWAKIGFDENLPAVEDTDFYLKLCTSMRCGHHLAETLFFYSGSGGRGAQFHRGPDYQRVMGILTSRYGGAVGSCCGTKTPIPPVGQKQPNDVLAMALWHGNRSEHGRITARLYPRLSFPRTTWVDPRDVGQSPHLWELVEQPAPDKRTGMTSLVEMANAGMSSVVATQEAPLQDGPLLREAYKPNLSRVLSLTGVNERANKPLPPMTIPTSRPDPIFIFPPHDYPSYHDIRQLVKLSGFQTLQQGDPWKDEYADTTFIVVSPDRIPPFRNVPYRMVAWQLEYAGDYAHNYDDFKGEIWASDRAWASGHGAKYVLMGSHADLRLNDGLADSYEYDVTMLGYMIQRRSVIKERLQDLIWPADYPGHGTHDRDEVLRTTRVMLHVHQHEKAQYVAPQRFALAAAYSMTLVSETLSDPTDFRHMIRMADYNYLPEMVMVSLNDRQTGRDLHEYLCKERTFRSCVLEALK